MRHTISSHRTHGVQESKASTLPGESLAWPQSSSFVFLRLLLESTANDATDLHEYLSNPAVYKYEPGDPINIDEALQLSQERASTSDFWAMELTDSGKMIGHIYFKQIEPLELRTWEIGYIVNPAYQGEGYGTEAVAALLRKEFEEKNIHRVFAHCNPEGNSEHWADQ